ncbi:hypothetical protein ACP70R_039524 [Stipagrostis hirtigluma subsp. patula]
MDQSSGDAMSIFDESIDVRRPGRSRRDTQKNLSPGIEQPVNSSVERLHQRKAVAERERARAESELSRARTMGKELERQIEQANAKVRSHRSELQEMRASSGGGGGGGRRKKGLGADEPEDSNTLYSEVMQELDRVKRELRKLQREVRSAREAKAKADRDAPETTTSSTPRPASCCSRVSDGVKREAGGAIEVRALVELAAEAGGSREDTQATGGVQRDKSLGSDADERFATASSSDVVLRDDDMAMVRATAEKDHVGNDESALTVTQHEEHDGSSLLAAEAELTSARIELASIKEEGLRFANSIERTRRETARVADEILRLTEQETKATAQVRQLNAKLLRARSKLGDVTVADERAEAMLAELWAALRQLGEETEAAEKERALTELENRCVREDADNVGAEIAAAEQRVREAVRELEAARASEAAATDKVKAVLAGAMLSRTAAATPQRSGNVTIPRFEYEYLTGRAEAVREIAEKKVAAAEAWVEALSAGEKEVALRAEAIERELGETRAEEAEDADGQRAAGDLSQQRAHPRKRPTPTASETPAKSGRARTPSSVARKPRSTSFSMKNRRRTLIPKCLMLIAGRCRGQN